MCHLSYLLDLRLESVERRVIWCGCGRSLAFLLDDLEL